MENIREIFQSGQTHAVGPGPRKEIEEFSMYDIAEIILEVENNAEETSCTSRQ